MIDQGRMEINVMFLLSMGLIGCIDSLIELEWCPITGFFCCGQATLSQALPVRPSVRPSVHPSICPSVRASVLPSMRPLVHLSASTSIRWSVTHESKVKKNERFRYLGIFVGEGWGVDGGWMPLPTRLQRYCDPA